MTDYSIKRYHEYSDFELIERLQEYSQAIKDDYIFRGTQPPTAPLFEVRGCLRYTARSHSSRSAQPANSVVVRLSYLACLSAWDKKAARDLDRYTRFQSSMPQYDSQQQLGVVIGQYSF